MAYTIFDLIQKLIDIEKDALEIYKKIEEKAKDESKVICIVARAIEKEEQKHIEYYEKLRNNLREELDEAIDFYLYDRVAKLLFEFRSRMQLPKIDNVQDLIRYSLEFEKNNIGLLLDIQGRLLEKMDDVNNNVYKVITKIIEEEKKHEKMFEQLLISKK